jgi:DNA-damage-inducible protein D
MKSEEIKQLFEQFEAAAAELEGIECWIARELQTLLGYSKWENFEKVIQKTKDACKNEGEEIAWRYSSMLEAFKYSRERKSHQSFNEVFFGHQQ